MGLVLGVNIEVLSYLKIRVSCWIVLPETSLEIAGLVCVRQAGVGCQNVCCVTAGFRAAAVRCSLTLCCPYKGAWEVFLLSAAFHSPFLCVPQPDFPPEHRAA